MPPKSVFVISYTYNIYNIDVIIFNSLQGEKFVGYKVQSIDFCTVAGIKAPVRAMLKTRNDYEKQEDQTKNIPVIFYQNREERQTKKIIDELNLNNSCQNNAGHPSPPRSTTGTSPSGREWA